MEHQYEIYSEQEVVLNSEEDAERMALNIELGLENKDPAQDNASRFRFLNEDECFVFRVLFPTAFDLKDYRGFVPTRVLKEIRDYRIAYPKHEVKIMCPKPGEVDPVVIGGAHMYSWQNNYTGNNHIIARFGAELEDFSTLRKKAFTRIKERMGHIESLPMGLLANLAHTLGAEGA